MEFNSINYTKGRDIIIVSVPPEYYDHYQVRDICHAVKQTFPDNEILCFPNDIDLSVVREENPFI